MSIKQHFFGTTDSTQVEARKLLKTGNTAPFLATAAQQTAGQGRLGRAWLSPPGNFYGSLVWRAAVPQARYGEYSFVAAAALIRTIANVVSEKLTLKWPNDVLLNGRKCAGILIETDGDQNEFLIIGMGVNLRHAPPDDAVRTPAAALWPDFPINANRDAAFAKALSENFVLWHEKYVRHGFEIIRAEWLRHAHNIGEQITVNTPTETCMGIFAGIDEHGSLLLTQGGQNRTIRTADVS